MRTCGCFAEALSRCSIPVVAVGGFYAGHANYPAWVPCVATDNFKLIELARQHRIDVGLQRFAMFSVPATGETAGAWRLTQSTGLKDSKHLHGFYNMDLYDAPLPFLRVI